MRPFASNQRGLTSAEAARRLKLEGPNELPGATPRSRWSLAQDVLREPMFLLLIAAASIYLTLGDLHEALVLLASVVVVFAITLAQSYRTERTLQALRDQSSPRALVIRDGANTRIAGRDVVRGDLLILHEGDRIAADAIVRACDELAVDESLLTGESVPVRKTASSVPPPADLHPGGDDTPLVYAGTLIVKGQGTAEVTATGQQSEMGKIGKALESLTREPTRLQHETGHMVRLFAIGGLMLSAVVVVAYALTRGDWLGGLLAGVTLTMGILPEEFPVVLTIFLALGAWRLSGRNVLTRRAAVIETLGAATVLCVDKTGTLTENRMQVAALYAQRTLIDGADTRRGRLPEVFHEVATIAALASEIDPYDPMEKAIIEFAEVRTPAARSSRYEWQLVRRYGITPALLAVTHCWQAQLDTPALVAAKGAPEAIFDLCRLSAADRAVLYKQLAGLAKQGLRVLGVARASHPPLELPLSQRDFDFAFIGLLGLADPLRASVPPAVRECRAAGVRIVMITGDYPVTAAAIARQAGITAGSVLTGGDLSSISRGELAQRIADTTVFARIAPDQKLALVQVFQSRGEVVAMTGDGVNDAPALKAADIGVAMGGRGTDVAREAASLILLDDDFGSIVAAIALGRRIYDNIRHAMGYLVAVHVPIGGMALLPLIFGWPLLFYPVHIVFLEFVIDPACSIVFEAEPSDRVAMQRPPRDPKRPMFDFTLLASSLALGLAVLVAVAAVYAGALASGASEFTARAMGFATLVFGNLVLIFENRSGTQSLARTLRRPNRALWWVVGGALAGLGGALYVPPVARLFQFAPLGAVQIAICAAAALVAVLWFELVKLYRRRRGGRALAGGVPVRTADGEKP